MAPLSLPPKNFTVRHVVNAHFMNASLLLVFWSPFYLTAILGNVQPLFRHPFWRSAELAK